MPMRHRVLGLLGLLAAFATQTACGTEDLPRPQAVQAWHAYLWAQHYAWKNEGASRKVSCHHGRGSVEPPGTAQSLARGNSRVPVPARTGFNDCKVDRLRFRGESRAVFYDALPPDLPARVRYDGELRFTEGVRGLCTVLIEETGRWPNTRYTGWFCGHDASELPLPAKR